MNAMLNLNAAYEFYSKRKIATSEKYGMYGLQVLWAWVQDDGKLTGEMVGVGVGEFVQLLTSEYCRQEREKYINLCLKQVQKGVSFGQSLRTIQLILKDYSMGSII